MNMLCRIFSISIAIVICSLATASAQTQPKTTRLLRFPTTNDRDIVFCYAGQLYTVGKDGGTARRLTSGPGYTSFSRFSPDGTQIAFSSEYDGNREVYVMPAEGGVPKRLTTSATLGRDDVSDRMRAAVKALRERAVAKIVMAVPVGPPDTFEELAREADEAVCLSTPPFFQAVGQYYEDFSQTSDDDVRELLTQAALAGEASD